MLLRALPHLTTWLEGEKKEDSASFMDLKFLIDGIHEYMSHTFSCGYFLLCMWAETLISLFLGWIALSKHFSVPDNHTCCWVGLKGSAYSSFQQREGEVSHGTQFKIKIISEGNINFYDRALRLRQQEPSAAAVLSKPLVWYRLFNGTPATDGVCQVIAGALSF